MIKVRKASAGSGKTYLLAHTYLSLLLGSGEPNPYRHILAVTFTNKATADMKARILRDLSKEAEINPAARKLLLEILHDYSSFSISTIDKFFQQALRSFAREIGRPSLYQIELDKKSLIHEAMDRVLDGLTTDSTDLLEWCRRNVQEQLSQGNKVSVETPLYSMGELVSKDDFRTLREEMGVSEDVLFDKKRLSDAWDACKDIIDRFHKRVGATVVDAAPLVRNRHAVTQILEYQKDLQTHDWLSFPASSLRKDVEGSLFLDLFLSDSFKVYNTAHIVLASVYSMGVAREFYEEFAKLLAEKNIMCLDESNTILRDIIDGSDAPFVYEKLGVRYENFLLDEFQDTSRIQWANFVPLLSESDSNHHENLVVGDVKQSIYRWRDSDWNLLATGVQKQFPGADVLPMDNNWRSAQAVVDFNNDFFKYAAQKIGQSELYADVKQNVKTAELQEGEVKIDFCEKGKVEETIYSSILAALEQGARKSDIAILVRGHIEGQKVAAFLIEKGIKVISDDSLSVKSSLVVRRLVSLLSGIDNPKDSVGAFLASELDIHVPESHHSLVDLCEDLLRQLKSTSPEDFAQQTLFVQAFLDDVQSFVQINGNDLHAFIDHWKNANPFISCPQDNDAIRIMTVHKSKGLEYPYIIFPYAEKVERFVSDEKWCKLLSPLVPECMKGIYPVRLSSESVHTLFDKDYEREKVLQDIDAINVFYVALTRAEKTLHVISTEPGSTFQKALAKGNPDCKNFSQILYCFCETNGWHFGSPYNFLMMERKDEDNAPEFQAQFDSIPLNPDPQKPRIQCSEEAKDFFGEDGVGAKVSVRLLGIELHELLSRVVVPEDLEDDGSEAYKLLSERIAAHPDWFAEGLEVLNEVEIVGEDGRFNRPDRVIRRPDGTVVVIDYKFGEWASSFVPQVRRYMRLCHKLGETRVEGYIWYVREDKVEAVSLPEIGDDPVLANF